MAVQADEVLDEHVMGAALQGDVVVTGVNFAMADDDASAAGIHGVGVGRITGRDNADVFNRDVLPARNQVKAGRIRQGDAVHVQPLDAGKGNQVGPGDNLWPGG